MPIGRSDFNTRILDVLAQEELQPVRWYYLSFADNSGFKGVCIVEGRGITHCLLRCNALGINPHGEVIAVPIPTDQLHKVPDSYRNRLLSKADLETIFDDLKSLAELEEEYGGTNG